MSKDVCLQENVGFEESVENLNLIKEFCEKYIRPFCFNFEDFLYSPMAMKINKLAFIAELFWYFELEPNREIVPNNHVELFREYIKSNSTVSFIRVFISIITVFFVSRIYQEAFSCDNAVFVESNRRCNAKQLH